MPTTSVWEGLPSGTVLLTHTISEIRPELHSSKLLDLCTYYESLGAQQIVWVRGSRSKQVFPSLISLFREEDQSRLEKVCIKYLNNYDELLDFLLNFHLVFKSPFAIVLDELEWFCGNQVGYYQKICALSCEAYASAQNVSFVCVCLELNETHASTGKLSGFFHSRVHLDGVNGGLVVNTIPKTKN